MDSKRERERERGQLLLLALLDKDDGIKENKKKYPSQQMFSCSAVYCSNLIILLEKARNSMSNQEKRFQQ